ncbi:MULTISPECIES: UDP-N-acetylmuramate dehydrogenase [unclassified Moraxella]|uniref:UDP-N-acetylmuramate dehydrogenase n=1 Tax=unclassified Moraxella TaxID=2685852 RepID=UPI003AF52DF6
MTAPALTNATLPPQGFTDISHLSTMALQCHAKQWIRFEQLDEVAPTFARLAEQQLPFVILSNGSNTLLPAVLEAVVISPTLMGQHVIAETADSVTLEVMAGEPWHELVVSTVNQGWYGLENLALIPSWVGASPVQNIGAYGVQVEDVIESVTAFHIPTLTFHQLSRAECEFGYRDSRFKREVGQWLITSVTFNLHKNPQVNINYGDVASVASEFAKLAGREQPTPVDTMNAIIQIRQSKIPETSELPNCGSFFQNPIVSQATAQALLADYPTLVHYPVKDHDGNPTDNIKLAAGWLIDQAGLKGKGIAPILTHVHQALVLTNHAPYRATQADIERTMHYIQQVIIQKFGIELVPEPVWIESNGSIKQTH